MTAFCQRVFDFNPTRPSVAHDSATHDGDSIGVSGFQNQVTNVHFRWTRKISADIIEFAQLFEKLLLTAAVGPTRLSPEEP